MKRVGEGNLLGEIRKVKQSCFRRENQRRNPEFGFDFFWRIFTVVSLTRWLLPRRESEREGGR